MGAFQVGQRQRTQCELFAHRLVQISDACHHPSIHIVRFGQAGKHRLSHVLDRGVLHQVHVVPLVQKILEHRRAVVTTGGLTQPKELIVVGREAIQVALELA